VHLIIALTLSVAVVTAAIAPLALLGRRIERQRHREALDAVRERVTTPAEAPLLPAQGYLSPEEERHAMQEVALAARARRTALVLDRLEAGYRKRADELMSWAFDQLGLTASERAWACLGTGEQPAVALA
jgi:hypothetical protein